MDPITALSCGAGAAFLLLGERGTFLHTLALCVAFYGVYRATRARAALGLMAPLFMSFALQSFWRLTGGDVHEGVVHDAPNFLGGLVFAGTLIGLAIVMRAGIGKGLVGLVAATLVVAILARLLSALLSFGTAEVRLLSLVFSSGFDQLMLESRVFVAAALLVLGAKLRGAPAQRPVGLMLGAAGMTILVATLGTHAGTKTFAAVLPWLGWLVGWGLTAVGVASLARNGAGAAGWLGLGLVVLQIPVGGILAFAITEGTRYPNPDIHPMAVSAFLGFGGVAIATFAGKGSPLPRARFTAACLMLASAHGVLVELAIMGLRVRYAPGWGAIMGSLYDLGLPLLATYLVFFAAPPKDQEAAAS